MALEVPGLRPVRRPGVAALLQVEQAASSGAANLVNSCPGISRWFEQMMGIYLLVQFLSGLVTSIGSLLAAVPSLPCVPSAFVPLVCLLPVFLCLLPLAALLPNAAFTLSLGMLLSVAALLLLPFIQTLAVARAVLGGWLVLRLAVPRLKPRRALFLLFLLAGFCLEGNMIPGFDVEHDADMLHEGSLGGGLAAFGAHVRGGLPLGGSARQPDLVVDAEMDETSPLYHGNTRITCLQPPHLPPATCHLPVPCSLCLP